MQNWQNANEGLVRSIVSLADTAPAPTAQSSESLQTISSLLEEPDMMEHHSLDPAVGRQEEEREDQLDVLPKEKENFENDEAEESKAGGQKTEELEIELESQEEEDIEGRTEDLAANAVSDEVENKESVISQEEEKKQDDTEQKEESGMVPRFQAEEVALLLELADASLEHADTTNLAASAEDQTEERRASSPTCDSAATMKPSWSESSLGLADQSCQSFYSALDTTPDPGEADSPASPVTVRKARLRAADLDTAAVELSPVSLAAGSDRTETSPPQSKKESPGILQEKTVHPQAEVPQVQPISVSTAERRKPEISPKPVPAPRHFFLARPGEEEEGSAPVREGTVKDRARSFSCLPSYQVGTHTPPPPKCRKLISALSIRSDQSHSGRVRFSRNCRPPNQSTWRQSRSWRRGRSPPRGSSAPTPRSPSLLPTNSHSNPSLHNFRKKSRRQKQ